MYSQKIYQSIEKDTEMTTILKLQGKDFKTAVINMF